MPDPNRVNARLLGASAEADEAEAQQTYQQAQGTDAAAEQTRGQIEAGLGGGAQMSGAYSGTQARDLSKYTQGLTLESEWGSHRDTMSKLGRAGEGQGAMGQLYGQVREVNQKYQAAYEAAKAGNFDQADALRAEGDALAQTNNLTGDYAGEGQLKSVRVGQSGMFQPLSDTGAAQQALGSPTGMLVGSQVARARALQDPNSQESVRFRDSLTGGALAAVDAAHENAVRALATQERGAARGGRDALLGRGGASAQVATAAVAARTAERFATQRAGVETEVGAQKAQIFSQAAQVYETFRADFAKSAVSLASAWVNDQSGVRDNFRQLQAQMSMNYIGNLTQLAGQKIAGAAHIKGVKEGPGQDDGGWVDDTLGFVGTVVGAMAMCWVAVELFGFWSPTTLNARRYANTHDNWFTRLYRRQGRRWAGWLQRHRWARPLAKPAWLLMARLGKETR